MAPIHARRGQRRLFQPQTPMSGCCQSVFIDPVAADACSAGLEDHKTITLRRSSGRRRSAPLPVANKALTKAAPANVALMAPCYCIRMGIPDLEGAVEEHQRRTSGAPSRVSTWTASRFLWTAAMVGLCDLLYREFIQAWACIMTPKGVALPYSFKIANRGTVRNADTVWNAGTAGIQFVKLVRDARRPARIIYSSSDFWTIFGASDLSPFTPLCHRFSNHHRPLSLHACSAGAVSRRRIRSLLKLRGPGNRFSTSRM